MKSGCVRVELWEVGVCEVRVWKVRGLGGQGCVRGLGYVCEGLGLGVRVGCSA